MPKKIIITLPGASAEPPPLPLWQSLQGYTWKHCPLNDQEYLRIIVTFSLGWLRNFRKKYSVEGEKISAELEHYPKL